MEHRRAQVRSQVARRRGQPPDQSAHKRVARAGRVHHPGQRERRAQEEAVGAGQDRTVLALFDDDIFRPEPVDLLRRDDDVLDLLAASSERIVPGVKSRLDNVGARYEFWSRIETD